MILRCDELMPVTRLRVSHCPVPRLRSSPCSRARRDDQTGIYHGPWLFPCSPSGDGYRSECEVGDLSESARNPPQLLQRLDHSPFRCPNYEMSFLQLACLPPLTFQHPRWRHHVLKALVGALRHPIPPPRLPPTIRPPCSPRTVTD